MLVALGGRVLKLQLNWRVKDKDYHGYNETIILESTYHYEQD